MFLASDLFSISSHNISVLVSWIAPYFGEKYHSVMLFHYHICEVFNLAFQLNHLNDILKWCSLTLISFCREGEVPD